LLFSYSGQFAYNPTACHNPPMACLNNDLMFPEYWNEKKNIELIRFNAINDYSLPHTTCHRPVRIHLFTPECQARQDPSSKYRPFYSAPHSAVTGPVEFHSFSKWNHAATDILSLFCSPKKDCKTVPISLHRHYKLGVLRLLVHTIVKKDGSSSARCKISPWAPIVIIPSPFVGYKSLI
jgi:hypothetical protein